MAILPRVERACMTTTRPFKHILTSAILFAVISSVLTGSAMAIDPVKIDEGEHESMLVRRALREEIITADIALRLAEMVFIRIYGKPYTDERSPLILLDH